MCPSLFAGSIPVGSTITTTTSFRRIIMGVRHVHARPGEYIAVHRGHGGGGGSSGGGEGCFGLLAIIFVIWLIASFWEIIVGSHFVCCGLADLDFSSSHLVRHMLDFFKTREPCSSRIPWLAGTQGSKEIYSKCNPMPRCSCSKHHSKFNPILQQIRRLWQNTTT